VIDKTQGTISKAVPDGRNIFKSAVTAASAWRLNYLTRSLLILDKVVFFDDYSIYNMLIAQVRTDIEG